MPGCYRDYLVLLFRFIPDKLDPSSHKTTHGSIPFMYFGVFLEGFSTHTLRVMPESSFFHP